MGYEGYQVTIFYFILFIFYNISNTYQPSIRHVSILETLSQATLSPHERIVGAAGPLRHNVHQPHLRITHPLDIYCVDALSVYECIFGFSWCFDGYVGSVDCSQHVWKLCNRTEFKLWVEDWTLVSGESNVCWSQFAQCSRDVINDAADRRLRQANTASNHPLETSRSIELQSCQNLRFDRYGTRASCRPFKLSADQLADFFHWSSRKACHFEHLIVR